MPFVKQIVIPRSPFVPDVPYKKKRNVFFIKIKKCHVQLTGRPGNPLGPDGPGKPGTPFSPGRPGAPFNPGAPFKPRSPFMPGRPGKPGCPFGPLICEGENRYYFIH